MGWYVGANGGGEGGFGIDIYGFGGHLGGFGRAAFGGGLMECGHWDGLRDGGGTDLRRQIYMVKTGEVCRQWGSVTGGGKAQRGGFPGESKYPGAAVMGLSMVAKPKNHAVRYVAENAVRIVVRRAPARGGCTAP